MRAACERCRTHKLRCIADKGGLRCCVRCKSLGVECYYSPQRRPGRPPVRKAPRAIRGSAAAASQEVSHGSAATHGPPKPDKPAPHPLHHESLARDLLASIETTEDLVLPDTSFGDIDDNFLSFPATENQPVDDFVAAFLSIDELSSIDQGANISAFEKPRAESIAQPAITHPTPPQNGGPGSLCTLENAMGQDGACPSRPPESPSNGINDACSAMFDSTPPLQMNQWRTVRLSELASQLSTNKYNTRSHHPQDIEQFASHVLTCTTSFIQLLTSFYSHTPPADGLNSKADANTRLHDEPQITQTSVDTSHYLSPPSTSPSISSVRLYPTEVPLSTPPALDMPSTLQLLSCFLRLLSLHATLYANIREHLKSSASVTDSTSLRSPFPDLRIASFSLAGYPRFQYRLLLQVCLHTLGRVELLLGLPDGLRLSARHDGGCETNFEGNPCAQCVRPDGLGGDGGCHESTDCLASTRSRVVGVLEAGNVNDRAGMGGIVQAAMHQGAGDEAGGGATVHGISTILSELRGLLRGNIEI